MAAVKSGRTKSTELLVRLVEGTWDLVADDILIAEYERYALEFDARGFFDLIRRRIITIEQRDEDILKVQAILPRRITCRCRSCSNLLAHRSNLDIQ